MYKDGTGVARDYDIAMSLYRRAAEKGNTRAYFWLGWMYEHGAGVSQDKQTARDWYGKATSSDSEWVREKSKEKLDMLR